MEKLFSSHRKKLIGKIHRQVGCRETAEDIAHDSFERLHKAMNENEVDYPKAFLYQIAENFLKDYFRRKKTRDTHIKPKEFEEVANTVPSLTPAQDEALASRQLLEKMDDVLKSMPKRRRDIFILKRVHKMRNRDIADHFGISESAVEKNLRTALLQCLERKNKIDPD